MTGSSSIGSLESEHSFPADTTVTRR